MPFRNDERFLKCFLAETDQEAEKLYEQYGKLVSRLADKYSSWTGLDALDLIQEGMIGLARAKRDFEEARSDTFHTFAIYKIKDAMREFSSKQSADVSTPHYIREASRLANKLKKVLEMAGLVKCTDFVSVWEQSATCDRESDLSKDITSIRQTIRNLANSSCTSVPQLLERAELYPAIMAELDQYAIAMEVSHATNSETETNLLQRLIFHKSVDKLQAMISEEDYNLLYNHFVEGKTVRELAMELGIKASSVTVKIHNIVGGLQKKREQIME